MSPLQTRLYYSLASDAARHLHGLSVFDRRRFRQVSQCVQYMLMAASNPGLLVRSQIGQHQMLREVMAEGLPPKLRKACCFAREWASTGRKVLIWSTFVSSVEHLAGLLSDLGAEYIHGGVTTSDDEELQDSREAVIRRFNDSASNTRILIANPAACSEGISLHHVCHHAIYLDRNYNAAQYLQSEDRIHRIGVPRDLTTYIVTLSTPDTIDVSVARRLAVKVKRMANALNDPCLNISPISLDGIDDADANGIDSDDIDDIKMLLGVSE
jgi:SNF2 family DNA or RNA helicase